LDLLKLFIECIKLLKEVLLLSKSSLAISIFINSLHFFLEHSMVSSENSIFIWKLLRDIGLTLEDGFEIFPF